MFDLTRTFTVKTGPLLITIALLAGCASQEAPPPPKNDPPTFPPAVVETATVPAAPVTASSYGSPASPMPYYTVTVEPGVTPEPSSTPAPVPYPKDTGGFEQNPTDTTKKDGAFLFSETDPNPEAVLYRQLMYKKLAEVYNLTNRDKEGFKPLDTSQKINDYIEKNFNILVKVVPDDGWTFVFTEKRTGNTIIPMVWDENQKAFLPFLTMLPVGLGVNDLDKLQLEQVQAPKGAKPILTYDASGNIIVGYYKNGVLHSWINVSKVDPAQMLVSSVDGAVITPEAKVSYDIQSPESWPEEMRAYANRPTDSWGMPDNPDYVTDAEYDAFLKEARRTFIGKQGVDVENLTDEQILYQYMKWGMENKAVLEFSPAELSAWNQDFLGYYTSPVVYRADDGKIYDGLGADVRNPFLTEEQYNKWCKDEEARRDFDMNKPPFIHNLSVFGRSQEVITQTGDFLGDSIALFRLPGVSTDKAVGQLIHTYRDGKHQFIPLAVNFEELSLSIGTYVVGSLPIDGGAQSVFPYNSDVEMLIRYARGTFAYKQVGTVPYTLSDMQSMLGRKTINACDRGEEKSGKLISVYYPFNLGIPGVNVIYPYDGTKAISAPVWPWEGLSQTP